MLDAVKMLKQDEKYMRFPYKDSVGVLTVAYGRNLESNGISEAEATIMLENDLALAYKDIEIAWPTFKVLDQVRQSVIAQMCFNLGIVRLMQFREMFAALEAKNYSGAAKAMLDSKWAHQVGRRAERLATIMESGIVPDGLDTKTPPIVLNCL